MTIPCPGYKRKRNRDGTSREYWAARPDLVRIGYRPKAVRLHYDQTPEGRLQLASRCQTLQAEMLAWAKNGTMPARQYDGTIAGLCRQYQINESSPYRRMKWNSAENVVKSLKIIERTVGARQVGQLLGPDFHRWHQRWGEPKKEQGKPRPWRAKHAMNVVRDVISFGVTLGYDDCFRADTILGKLRFPNPPPRTQKLTLEHVKKIRKVAHEMKLGSIAFATVLQFELSLRQKDVVGEWEPAPLAEGGIVYRGRRWVNGLTWSHIDEANILRKVTTKRGVPVEHDLSLSPMVMEEIAKVPVERRVGPVIISERTGAPYKNRKFSEAWRRVANAAGIPREVWNMDARSGAISELYDAGASTQDAMKHAGHQDPRMSAQYNRGSLEQTRRAALQRQAKRAGNKNKGRARDV
jgi:hypothetical protein